MVIKKYTLLFLLILCQVLSCGQQQKQHSVLPSDSLLQKSYTALEKHYNEFRNDSVKASVYARAYLAKGRLENNVHAQIRGYYNLAFISPAAIAEKYGDSIIATAKNNGEEEFIATGILVKVHAFMAMGKYKKALDYLLEAKEYAVTHNNVMQQSYINHQIGILRNDLGEYEEALKAFKEYVKNIEKCIQTEDYCKNNYGEVLFALADAYTRVKHYDSAMITAKKGLDIASKNEKDIKPAYFTMTMGISKYGMGAYPASIDSLEKAVKALLDINKNQLDFDSNITACYLYIGKGHEALQENDKAVVYYKKTDSLLLLQEAPDVFPELKDGYDFLIDYYEKKKDTVNELKYSRRNREIDSLLNATRKYIAEKIKDEDLDRKEKNITILEKIIQQYYVGIMLLLFIVLVVGYFTYHYYRRQRTYRERFEALYRQKDQKKTFPAKENSKDPEKLHIAPATLHKILENLEQFINEKQFLRNDVSLNTLAVILDTNPKYLSNIIHHYQQKNFIDYITDLRIHYTLNELETNSTFRRYSIKAIAHETGFNTSQSFSKAFYKRTGMYPSFYIKELEKSFRKGLARKKSM